MPRVSISTLGLVALVVGGTARLAAAERTRPVHIESTPPGAEVYVGDKESGSIGQTPLDTKLTPGEYVIILELAGHVPVFENLVVDKVRGRAARVPVTLQAYLPPSKATLVVGGTAPDGARVQVDGVDRGGLPLRMEVDAGAHQIEVIALDHERFEEWVEIEGGAEHQVTVRLVPTKPPAPPPGPRGPRPPLVVVRSGLELSWRRFRYRGATSDDATAPFDSNGRGMWRFEVETAPWRLWPRAWRAWPLSLVVAAGITPTDTATRGSQSANFNQRSMEAGLRYRFSLARRYGLGIDVGWERELFTFAGDLAYALPDVDYNFLRLGLRFDARVGPAVVWLAGENRLVAGGGDLGARFKAASADGFGVRTGGMTRLWNQRIEVGAEYALGRFGWSFEPNDNDPMYVATGGTDLFHAVRVWVGGAY